MIKMLHRSRSGRLHDPHCLSLTHDGDCDCPDFGLTSSDGVYCAHSPLSALSSRDRQQILDFQRFLGTVGAPDRAKVQYLRWHHPRGYAWIAYMKGEMGAPPLMWEGDDS